MSAFTEIFEKALAVNGISEYAEYADKFELLSRLLRDGNEKFNLTAITDDEKTAYKHFCDCLLVACEYPQGANIIDVGAGGGFPCLPVAIVRNDLQITALDSTAKKLGFIADTAKALGLSNVKTVTARAEEAGRTFARERYDCVTARAVARMNILCEWCIPMIKPGGAFIALKGKDGMTELNEASHALSVLHCTADAREYSLFAPEEQGRCIITVTKNAPTDEKYPRNNSQISKKPL